MVYTSGPNLRELQWKQVETRRGVPCCYLVGINCSYAWTPVRNVITALLDDPKLSDEEGLRMALELLKDASTSAHGMPWIIARENGAVESVGLSREQQPPQDTDVMVPFKVVRDALDRRLSR